MLADSIRASDFNLDIKNPSLLTENYDVRLTEKTSGLESQLSVVREEASEYLSDSRWRSFEIANEAQWETVRLGDELDRHVDEEKVEPQKPYRLVGVRLAGQGPFLRETKYGSELGATKLNRLSTGLFIYSRLFAWRGAFGIVPADLDGCFVSNEFPTYRIRGQKILPDFLKLYFRRPRVWQAVEKKCQGTTKASRNRFKEQFLLDMKISVPRRNIQEAMITAAERARAMADRVQKISDGFATLPLDSLAEIYRDKL